MKNTNLVRALEKIGLKVECIQRYDIDGNATNQHFVCVGKRNKCDWFLQPHNCGEVFSVQAMRLNENNDYQSDYFAGSFYRVIKHLVKVMAEE